MSGYEGFAALGDAMAGGVRRRTAGAFDDGFQARANSAYALERATKERALRLAQESMNTNRGMLTGDLVTRALGGDNAAMGQLGAVTMGMADGQPNFGTFTEGAKDAATMVMDREIRDALTRGDVSAAQRISAVKTDKVLPELGASGAAVFTPITGDVSLTPLGESDLRVDDATIAQRHAAAGASNASAQAALGRLGIAQAQFGLQRAGRWNPDGMSAGGSGGAGGGAAGAGAGKAIKLTEGQSKDLVYLTRGQSANNRLEQLGNNLTAQGGQQGSRGIADQIIRNLPGIGDSGAANYLVSGERQQAEQSAREFLSAVLRKDTGAAITESEMDIYGKTYLPQPGDSPANLEQKRAARQQALDAIETGLGTAAPVYKRPVGAVPPAAPRRALGDPAPAGAVPRARNPTTDEMLELRNGQWVPAR